MATKPSKSELEKCIRFPKCIRNVCILAHVDHGKTTVADCLLATNRVVSQRLAGSLRYLDDRWDEQERKITMKSSAVSLLNVVHDYDTESDKILLLNMIDTPGHIDFSSEVTAAVRVCDGAIILVDVVEGVCVQTRESIKQAFEQKAKMILVLNKLDRLFINKEVEEIFIIISQVIENCNSAVAQLYQYIESDISIDDSGLLFQPEKGNVIFASAIHGWGFTLRQIAPMFTNLLPGETVESLTKKLWNFDNYIDSNNKTIKDGAIQRGKTNIFTQLCLKTLKHIYYTIYVRMDREKIDTIVQKLKIENVTRDMKHNDVKVQIKAILEAWKPLADSILQQCYKVIPAPCAIPSEKIEYLLNQHIAYKDPYINECLQELVPHFEKCSSDNDTPVVLYVSKMFCVDAANLSQNKYKPLTLKSPEELKELKEEKENGVSKDEPEEEKDNVMVALARVFTGNLKIGQEVYVLRPGYKPVKKEIEDDINKFIENNKDIKKTTVTELYMLFGRELLLVDNIPAGNICAIGGFESAVLRTATVSSTVKCVPFVEQQPLEPVVRNVIEPLHPAELSILYKGLKDLMQSDSCVQVIEEETGETVLCTSGTVHLEKCLNDLKTKFAKIEILVSDPMVTLRETILPELSKRNSEYDESKTVTLTSGPFTISVLAVSLPTYISSFIEHNFDLLRTIEELSTFSKEEDKSFSSSISKLKENLEKVFSMEKSFWSRMHTKIWSVGARKDSINLLINNIPDYEYDIFTKKSTEDERNFYRFIITNTFKYSCKYGPLCKERLMNCAFIIQKFEFNRDALTDNVRLNTAAIQQQLNTTFKEALEKRTLRLMEPIFTTEIQVNTSILGKVYMVLSKRHGKVVDAVGMDDDEKRYIVRAELPVIESAGFADDIRKVTSGQAMPNLRFSHYEIINGDPCYDPSVDDEEDEGIDVATSKRATKMRIDVRKRKGLHVAEQVVTHGEKQRTLSKKK